jgi:CheY-like chemotaxis protein
VRKVRASSISGNSWDVSSLLEDLGCEVETAVHGNEALGKLADDPRIELLITCLVYPDTRWPSALSECDRG